MESFLHFVELLSTKASTIIAEGNGKLSEHEKNFRIKQGLFFSLNFSSFSSSFIMSYNIINIMFISR